MSQPNTPFSHSELIPQEETLEIQKKKGKLFIGLPRETSYQEKRICLTPDAVAALTAHGHRVLVEHNAGADTNFSDQDYSEAGAEITKDTAKIFACPTVLKVEPPSLKELSYMQQNSTLISALQLKTLNKSYFEKLKEKKITALAFEFIQDHDDSYPAVKALSEIAGTGAVLIASELLSKPKGNGLLFGNINGVPPAEVVVIGAGTVGEFAGKAALGLGANVRFFDNSLTKLNALQYKLSRPLATSTLQPKYLLKALKRADVVITAVRGNHRAPIIISQTMVEQMKPGSVIIDVSIDMGGCVETSEITSHDNPTFIKHGVIHYGVPNIPSRFARTASIALSNICTPYLLHIAENGGLENTLRCDKGLKNGLYFYHGILTNRSIANWFDLPYRDIHLLIF